MKRTSYTVTDKADEFTTIAGKRRAPGETIMLTKSEALWEVERGLIEPTKKDEVPAPAPVPGAEVSEEVPAEPAKPKGGKS